MKVLIAAPIREDEEIFKYYLEALDKLEKPDDVEIERFFIFHNSDHLIPLLDGKSHYGIYHTKEEYKKDEHTHTWGYGNFKSIVTMKNDIIDFTLKGGYDYVFMVDSDVILNPKTLVKLLESKKDIVAECFWTKWGDESQRPLPNAWHFDNYTINDIEFEKWKSPGLYRVGMAGACILINRKVFETGTNYNPIPNISYSFWEDRAFCIRAACNNFEVWLDTHYPSIHLYRPSEVEKFRKLRT